MSGLLDVKWFGYSVHFAASRRKTHMVFSRLFFSKTSDAAHATVPTSCIRRDFMKALFLGLGRADVSHARTWEIWNR